MEEQWKYISGYKDRYQISNFGRVKSLPFWKENGKFSHMTKEKILKQWKRSRYLLVDFWNNGIRDVRSIHVLVYETFLGKIPENHLVHHKDHDKFNNSVDNLEVMTSLEHNRHHIKGRKKKINGNK